MRASARAGAALALVALLGAARFTSPLAAQNPAVPPDVQAVIDKARNGQALTPADREKLQGYIRQQRDAAMKGGGLSSEQRAAAEQQNRADSIIAAQRGTLDAARTRQGGAGAPAGAATVTSPGAGAVLGGKSIPDPMAGAPPAIRAIMQRVRAGRASPADAQALSAYVKNGGTATMRQGAAATRSAGAGAALNAAFMLTGSKVCPDAKASPAPPAPASAQALDGLLQRIESAYGRLEKPSTLDALRQGIQQAGGPFQTSNMGAWLWLAGSQAGSVYVLADAARRDPATHELANLGAALNSVADYGNAYRVLMYAARLDPGDAAVANNLAVALANLDQLPSAERQLRHAVETEPLFGEAWFGLGRVLQCQGNTAGAIAAIKKAEELQPTPARKAVRRALEGKSAADANALDSPDADDGEAIPSPPAGGDPVELDGTLERPLVPDDYGAYIASAVQRLEAMKRNGEFAQAQVEAADNAGINGQILGGLRRRPGTPIRPHMEGGSLVLPISDDAIMEVLLRVRARYHRRWGEIEGRYQEAADRIKKNYDRELASIDIPSDTCHPMIDYAIENYGPWHGELNGLYTAMNAATQDYVTAMSPWIGALHDPQNGLAWEHLVLNEVAEENGVVLQAAQSYNLLPAMAHCIDTPGTKTPPPAPARKEPTPKDCKPTSLNLILVKMKVTCYTIEVSGGEGLMGSLKYNVRTKAGTVFIGGGLSAGFEGSQLPGQNAFKPQLEGKMGMLIGFQGGDFNDLGFTVSGKGGWGEGHEEELTTTVTIANGMTFSNGENELMHGDGNILKP